jgi:hypothetical protein
MRRNLFTLASALSAVLCVGVCVLWVRSYRVADAVGWSSTSDAVEGGTASGRLRLNTIHLPDGQTYGPPHLLHIAYPANIDPPTRRLPATSTNMGFAFERNGPDFLLLVPLWAVALSTGVGAWATHRVARRMLRAARLAANLCPACGYDLRATPGQCPECGMVSGTVPGKSVAISG